ncbi:type II toxin-antitoxin system VapC family toxin [Fictibacillus terranigra]|uniref:PIN domain-containing protein n=1 Tax=Fictibacillus terranigra TaxID=3058424 RepID=A0ABT8EBL6_9BACL|nr:PIN domain-containing protein [Fictibacillus sp. CENA-BCM004]MDN4075309.1 PIN domain-containing protein [Fictibacillus sp. CENA-BCM004]
MDEETVVLAAEIRRKGKLDGVKVKAPDAIIAATASIHQIKLVSHNDKDIK